MRKLTIAAAIAAGSALSAPAMAQTTTPSDHFNGPYIQGSIALDQNGSRAGDRLVFDGNGDGNFGDVVRTTTGADAFSPGFCNGRGIGPRADQGCADDNNDFGYGVRLGYDRRIGGGDFVVGGLIEGWKSESIDYTTGFSTTPANYVIARQLDHAVSARARLGYSPGDGRGLFYVTGGASYGDIDHDFLTTNGANAFTPTDDEWEFGWQAGGGAELMVLDNVSLGIEYLYSRYDDDSYSVNVSQGTAPATNPFLIGGAGSTDLRNSSNRFDIHSLRATVGFHF